MTRAVRLLLAAALLAAGGPVQAQLLGLTHDAGASQVVEIDAASDVSPIGGPELPTEVGYAAAAFDPFAGAIFALGPDPVAADGTLALFAFDNISGARIQIGNTGTLERAAALRFELTTQRLIAALVDPGTNSLRLASVDPDSAALTPVHSGVTNCCILEPGVASERSGEVLLVGRRSTDPDAERYLIRLSTSGDNGSTFTLLDGSLSVLAWDRIGMTLYGVQQQTTASPIEASAQLLMVDSSGSFTAIGPVQTDCCALAPGLATLALTTPDALFTVGGVVGGSAGIIEWNLNSGVAAFNGTLPSTTVINALFDLNAGLSPTSTTIDSIVPSPVNLGQGYSVTASVNSGALIDGGQINVADGVGNSCLIPVSQAAPSGSCALPSTQAGLLSITATYSGTGTLAPSQDSAAHEVLRAVSTTLIPSVVPSPVEVGQSYSVSVSVTGFGTPTGVVNIDDGLGESCQVILPATDCVLNAPSVGSRTITASYAGDSSNLPSSVTAAQQVIRAVSTTMVDSIVPEPSSVGDSYTVNVSVSGFGPTGNVSVSDGTGNSCSIALPASSCLLANSAAGSLTVTADYPGDFDNEASADSATHMVEPAVSTTVIDSLVPNPVVAGQPYTVAVSVSGFGTPTGTIAVSDDSGAGCSISLPQTECSLISNLAGNRVVAADYSGDADNLPSGDTASLLVEPAITVLQLQTSAMQVLYDVPVNLLATVLDGATPVTGTIAFSIEGVLIPGCENVLVASAAASCMFTPDFIGVRVIRAEYGGDANNLPAAAEFQLGVQALPIPAMSPAGLALLMLLLCLIALRHRSLRA